MGYKGFEVDFTLGSETDREFVVTRLGWGAYVRVGELVKKEKRAYSISEGTLDVELLHQQHGDGDDNLCGTHSNLEMRIKDRRARV